MQRVGVVLNTDALGEFPYRIVVPIVPALDSLGRSPLSVAVRVPREGRGSSRVEARLLVNIEQFLLPRKLVSEAEVAEWEADDEMDLLLVPERLVSCPSRVLVDLGLGLSRHSMAELAAATSILFQLQDGGN
ncbi:MAG: hypothetical protein ACK4P3_01660 [Fimbriimonadaceae bacterium]